MSFETISLEIDGRVATVTLDRASSGNLIDERMAVELRDVCDRVRSDEGLWVLVLTGSGDAFSRGSDPALLRPVASTGALHAPTPAGSIAAIEKPVIAALNGDAIDQGLELALACDIRVASSDAGFGLTQVKNGVMPWDGGTQRLPRLVGRGRAMDMILTSRRVGAGEALEMGLVNQVVEPGDVLRAAHETASTIASHGPVAARYLKEAVLLGLDGSLDHGLRLEADLNVILQSTGDRAEGISSFLKRRAPEYRGE